MKFKNYKILFLFLLIILSTSNVGGTYLKKELDLTKDDDLSSQPQSQIVVPGQVLVPDQTQSTQVLRDEITRLRKEFADQKEITSNLLERVTEILNQQNRLNVNFNDTTKVIQDISSFAMDTLSQQTLYKDAFILNPVGKPVGFIDAGLKIYEYDSGNLLGWIKPDTNEIVRNFDNSVVAIIENDFVLNEAGAPVGTVERSENLKWDREKLYSKVQKTPISHFFVRPSNPKQFILSPYRTTDWSTQMIEELLYFSEKRVQKIK